MDCDECLKPLGKLKLKIEGYDELTFCSDKCILNYFRRNIEKVENPMIR